MDRHVSRANMFPLLTEQWISQSVHAWYHLPSTLTMLYSCIFVRLQRLTIKFTIMGSSMSYQSYHSEITIIAPFETSRDNEFWRCSDAMANETPPISKVQRREGTASCHSKGQFLPMEPTAYGYWSILCISGDTSKNLPANLCTTCHRWLFPCASLNPKDITWSSPFTPKV